MANDFCLGAFECWRVQSFKFYFIIIKRPVQLKNKYEKDNEKSKAGEPFG